jgi:putative acetyltransferase
MKRETDDQNSHIEIVVETATSENARRLIAELDADLRTRYPDAPINGIEPQQVAGESGVFVLALCDGVPVGCGAFRRLDARTVEIKRMFVRAAARRRGVAACILSALESIAVKRGFSCARLETGTAQPEALAFYERAGYQRISAFGSYVENPHSVCFEKTLARH